MRARTTTDTRPASSRDGRRGPGRARARRGRGVASALVVFGLFLGLQIGASFEAHDHATVADGIECVVCHGVRVAPPAERPVRIVEAPDVVSVEWAPTPVAPTPASLALTGDPPRGPPAA